MNAATRFIVNSAAVRRYAANHGAQAPEKGTLDRLQVAAAYAGIAYEAGEEGRDLTDALPIFAKLPDGKGLAIDLDRVRQTAGDGQLTAAGLEALDITARICRTAYDAGRSGKPISAAIPFFVDMKAHTVEGVYKQ